MAENSKYEIDMCSGSLMKKMLKFSFPLMMTSTLQLLYNAADVIVVGNFAGTQSLSAVGSVNSLINLIICLFTGLSVGSSVVMSRYYGAKDYDEIEDTVHTSITVAIISGIIVAIIGFFITPWLLKITNTPEDVIEKSTLYMRIYFAGMPFNMVYLFGAAILRAVGDTKRPLYFLSIAGLFNVGLNLIFVIVWHMDVAGVALATIIAQIISMIFVVRCLIKSDGPLRLDLKKLRINKDKFAQIVKIGLPAGIQGALFSISNVLIQSTVNTFGSVVMAGYAAAGNIESFIYMAINSISQANVSFASQNLGAKKYKRMRRCLWTCVGLVMVIGAVLGLVVILFSEPLISLYNSDPEVIKVGVERLFYLCLAYCVCGIMDVAVAHLRGIGKAIIPTIITAIFVCGTRILWVKVVFPLNPTMQTVYLSYPVSWTITSIVLVIMCAIVSRQFPKEDFD